MGKTTVSNYLSKQCNIPVLDADHVAREVVIPGSPVLHKIAERYGATVLLPDGRLDRVRLGEIVFNSLPERHWLEQQIHPPVRDRFEQELQSPKLRAESMVVLVVPLLFEARMTDLVNEIWVVTCTAEQQIERLMQRAVRDGDRYYYLSREQVEARISSQMPIESKVERADIILDNSRSEEVLFQRINLALMQTPQEMSSYS